MARRARASRQAIPGYDEFRPNRAERAQDHRKVRHAASQMLRTVADAEELAPLPEVRPDHHHDKGDSEPIVRDPSRFAVGKTKFWKRRRQYKEFKASLDASWPDSDPIVVEDQGSGQSRESI